MFEIMNIDMLKEFQSDGGITASMSEVIWN